MMHNDGCSRLRRVALVLAMTWLSGCATVSSDVDRHGVCSPVVEYSWEFQAQMAADQAALSELWAVAEMLADYAEMCDETRVYGEG